MHVLKHFKQTTRTPFDLVYKKYFDKQKLMYLIQNLD